MSSRHTSRRLSRPFIGTLLLLGAFLLAAPSTAMAGDGEHRHHRKHEMLEELANDPEHAETVEAMKALREWTRSHIRLGRHFMRGGDYATAAAHFDTVLQLQIDPDFAARVRALHEAVRDKRRAARGKDARGNDGDGIMAGSDEDRTRRGGKRWRKGRRGHHGPKHRKLKLYVASARAHALDGNDDLAMQRIDEGIAAAEEADAERMVEWLQKIKNDPSKLQKMGRDREVDVEELETKIQEAEGKLPIAP